MTKKLNFFFLYNITAVTTMNLISCSCIVPEAKIELTKIIKSTDLGSIYTGQRTFLKKDEILTGIKKANNITTKDLTLKDFQIKEKSDNSVTILGLKNYAGQVTLKYKMENWKKLNFNNIDPTDMKNKFNTSNSEIISNNFAVIYDNTYYVNQSGDESSSHATVNLWKITKNKNENNIITNVYQTMANTKEWLKGFWPVNNKIYMLLRTEKGSSDDLKTEVRLVAIDPSDDQLITLKEWKEDRPTELICVNKILYLLFINGFKKFDMNDKILTDNAITFSEQQNNWKTKVIKKVIKYDNNHYILKHERNLYLFNTNSSSAIKFYEEEPKGNFIKNFVIIRDSIFCLINNNSGTVHKIIKISNFINSEREVTTLEFENEKIINIVAIDNNLYVAHEKKIIKNEQPNGNKIVFWKSELNKTIGLLDKDTTGNLYAIIIKKDSNNDVDLKISEAFY